MSALEKLEARMGSGEPFTYGQMCAFAFQHGADEGKDRLVDRTMQKWRRKGWASFKRVGKSTVWAATGERPDPRTPEFGVAR